MEPYLYGIPQYVNSWWKDIFVSDIDGRYGYFRFLHMIESSTVRKYSQNITLAPEGAAQTSVFKQYVPNNLAGFIYTHSEMDLGSLTGNISDWSGPIVNNGPGSVTLLITSDLADLSISGIVIGDSPTGYEYNIYWYDTTGNYLQIIHNNSSGSPSASENSFLCAGNVDIFLRNGDMAKLVWDGQTVQWRVAKMGSPWAEITL